MDSNNNSSLFVFLDHCDFVEDVPDFLTCGICFGSFRAPHLLSCCGVKYCETCIQAVQSQGKPCPKCRGEHYDTMLDKTLQRAVYNLKVHCVNRKNGCQWQGEVLYLEEHLERKCQLAEVTCQYCKKSYPRGAVTAHQEEECSGRPMEVRMMQELLRVSARLDKVESDCEQWKSEAEQLKDELKQTKQVLVDTSDNLKTEFEEKRIKYEREIAKLQNTVQEMKEQSLSTHDELRLSLNELTQVLPWAQKCQTFAENLSRGNRDWEPPIWQSPPPISFSSSLPPCQFIMKEFTSYRDSSRPWYSPPFYSWSGGHKLCLLVHANGDGGKYVSVGVSKLAGEFDDQLREQPPNTCIVRVSVLNLLGNTSHMTHDIAVDLSSSHVKGSSFEKEKWTLLSKQKISPDTSRKTSGVSSNKYASLPSSSRKEGKLPFWIGRFISHASMKGNPLTGSKYWSERDCMCFRIEQCMNQ